MRPIARHPVAQVAAAAPADHPTEPVLSEIDAMRIDASFRALPDHLDRPDGPAAAIDNSLLAAAHIQASINRQRWRPPEPPKPASDRGLNWLSSLTACVVAVALLVVLWDAGTREHAPQDLSATASVVAEPGESAPPPSSARESTVPTANEAFYDPAHWLPIGFPVGTAIAAIPPAAPRDLASPVIALRPEAGATPPEAMIVARRPLYSRERPAPRRFSDSGSSSATSTAVLPNP